MAMKITINEASPRKFRSDPSDRGVGGKWGPADSTGFVADMETRKGSSLAWRNALNKDEPFADDMFRTMLEDALDDMALSWDENPNYVPYLAFRPNASIRGYDSTNPSDAVIQASVILEPECPNETVAHWFARIINSKIGDGGFGFAYSIIASEEECTPQNSPADKVEWHVAVDIQMTNADLLDWLTEPNGVNISRKDAVSGVIGNMDDGISEVISLWKRISKEISRTFHESKCSMQKRIESFRK